MVVSELSSACETVARRARWVRLNADRVEGYADSLGPAPSLSAPLLDEPERTAVTWFWLSLDAINFGSGWFPTLAKAPEASGYRTISGALARRFEHHGPWSARELLALGPDELADVMGQARGHELMGRFAASLNDLGGQLLTRYGGDPRGLIAEAGGSAAALVDVVSAWPCFADASRYGELVLPFAKRAQILAADLARHGAARFDDLDALTMFADNLVPHVLRLDGVLDFAPDLVARIEAGELIEHGSPEEVEVRALAVVAVEAVVAAGRGRFCAAQVDALLWERGQGARYKASPRHRSRSNAY